MTRPLNKPLIRDIQLSILDPANTFDMTGWNTCIAGHCFRVLGVQGKLKPNLLQAWGPIAYASHEMGISYDEAHTLFTEVPARICRDRIGAVRKLDALLKRKETSLRGEVRSRSPRATPPVSAPAAAPDYWHGLPPTVEVDLTGIDALLREAEEEMLQPV